MSADLDYRDGEAIAAKLQDLAEQLEKAYVLRVPLPPPLQMRSSLAQLVTDALAQLRTLLPKTTAPKACAIVLRLERQIRAELELACHESVQAGNSVHAAGAARWAFQCGVLQSALLDFARKGP